MAYHTLRQTHTFTLLPVSKSTYEEIRSKLLAAEYNHCLLPDIIRSKEGILLNGIALVQDDTEHQTKQHGE